MYVTGISNSPGMTTGNNDIFTFKFNPSSGLGIWGTYLGSPATNNNTSNDVVVSPDSLSVYVCGTEQIPGLTYGAVDMFMI